MDLLGINTYIMPYTILNNSIALDLIVVNHEKIKKFALYYYKDKTLKNVFLFK